jgi:hypothetical protein
MKGLCATVTNAANGRSYFLSTVKSSRRKGQHETGRSGMLGGDYLSSMSVSLPTMCPPRQLRCTDTAMLALSVSDWCLYIRRVEKQDGKLANVEIDRIPMVKGLRRS